MAVPTMRYWSFFASDVGDALRILQVLLIAVVIISWIVYRRRVGQAAKVMTGMAENRLASAVEDSLKSIAGLRADLAAKEERSKAGGNALTAERFQQLREMLDRTEQALRAGVAQPDLQNRAAAVKAATPQLVKASAEVHFESARELEATVSSVQSAPQDGVRTAPPEAIKKLADLAATARMDFDEGRTNGDLTAAAQSLARGKRALQEAATLAKALGLRIANPV